MLSPVVGPTQTAKTAIGDLQLLLRDGGKMYTEWYAQPITQIVVRALDEASRGRSPQAGLSPLDFAQAVGEVAGMQRAVIAIQVPEQFLERLGLSVRADPRPLPPPSYVAPEPPPEQKGEKKE